MEINGVEIKDTYAEGFGIKVTRILVTAATEELAKIAATEATGYGTSVIGCPAEAGHKQHRLRQGHAGAYRRQRHDTQPALRVLR